jgi:glutathione S-transferase
MSDYTLYYWSLPFRGQFVRAVLAYAGKTWTEAGDEAISRAMEGEVADMPVPFMGPPVLIHHGAGEDGADVTLSQTPAILAYLGETLGLLPPTPAGRALALKVAADANDLIDELTLDGGRQMWTPKRWAEFEPRLRKWMRFWEETGRRHGLKKTKGCLLGGDAPGLADIVTATLWTTMADRFPKLGAILEDEAPLTAALSRRVAREPALADLAERAWEDWGEAWCGGRIERSLRRVLEG